MRSTKTHEDATPRSPSIQVRIWLHMRHSAYACSEIWLPGPVTVGDRATVCALNRSTLHDNCLRATLSACLSPTHGFSRLEQSTSYTPAS